MAGGLVDTHVLMTLAALGLLALGQASEVTKARSPFFYRSSIFTACLKGNTHRLVCCPDIKVLTYSTDWGSMSFMRCSYVMA